MAMMHWQCRLFGPGLAPGGEPAELSIHGERIVLRRAQGQGVPVEIVAAAGDVRLRRVGVDDRGLEVAFATGGEPAGTPATGGAARGTYACHVLDAGDANAVLAALPGGAALDRRALAQADRSRRLRRRAGLAALALFFLFPLLIVLLVFANLDSLASRVVERIPRSQEMALRDRYLEHLRNDPTLRREGLRHRVVQDIGRRLTREDSRYDYVWFVAEDPAINAYALPGGLVVVNDGLIEATRSPEELAGVLAHEVQHVELRHGLEGIVKQAGLAVAVALVTGDASGTLGSGIGRRLAELKFSRDAEREADATGFERLVRSGIDPSGMASFFTALEARVGNGAPELLSTHPASARRAEALEARLAAYAGPPLRPLDVAGVGQWPPSATATRAVPAQDSGAD
jgi:Zn-dependent protease with chaperone function